MTEFCWSATNRKVWISPILLCRRGMSVEKIRAGIALALKQMTDRGWQADVCYIRPNGKAGQAVEGHLASAKYDCIVIGAGVRLPPQRLTDFEAVVNAVHKAAPAAPIAFNTRPDDSADAPRDGYVGRNIKRQQ